MLAALVSCHTREDTVCKERSNENFEKDKESLLQLYNALNGTAYTDASKLQVVTIESAVYVVMEKCRTLEEFDVEKYERTIKREGYDDGLQEGKQKVNRLTIILLEQNRTADLLRAAKDKEYQEQLLKEFEL